MRRYFNLPALCGLLVAAGIALSVRHAAAAPIWDGTWGAWALNNAVSTCTYPGAGSATGGATLNGNNAGQVVSWCANYRCGNTSSVQYLVRGYACPASGTNCEFTPGTAGQSIGSDASGPTLVQHVCQMGKRPYSPPPP